MTHLPNPAASSLSMIRAGRRGGSFNPIRATMDESDRVKLAVDSHHAKRKLSQLIHIHWDSIEHIKKISAEPEEIAADLRKVAEEIDLKQ